MDKHMIVYKTRIKQALTPSGLPDLDYALNPYVGCLHSCIYCYAREYTREKLVSEKWGQVVLVKENLIETLKRDTLRAKPGTVGLSTITDPYQPVESEYRLSRRSLEVLLSRGFKVSIQTKSGLVTRDLDILERWRGSVDVGFTITTLDSSTAKVIEPNSPPPRERAKALELISSRGIETWVFLGPILPGITDSIENIESIVELASSTRSTLYIDMLRVKPFMFKARGLQRELALKARGYKWKELFSTIKALCKKHGVVCKEAFSSQRV